MRVEWPTTTSFVSNEFILLEICVTWVGWAMSEHSRFYCFVKLTIPENRLLGQDKLGRTYSHCKWGSEVRAYWLVAKTNKNLIYLIIFQFYLGENKEVRVLLNESEIVN